MDFGPSIRSLKVAPKKVSTDLPQTYTLSDEQKAYLDQNGFLVIKELIDFATLYACKQRFSQICKGVVDPGNMLIVKEPSLVNSGAKGEDLINKAQDIHQDEIFMSYTEHPRLLDAVSQLIGGDVSVAHSMLINKPPGASRHPPHQNSNRLYHGILDEAQYAPESKRVQLQMSPGDTALFHPLLVHGSGPNVSKRYRKAITAHYANSACQFHEASGALAAEVEAEARRRGYQLSYTDVWKFKSKHIKGVKSNL